MNISIEILDGPLPDPGESLPGSWPLDAGVGAWVRFDGIVRRDENGRELSGLRYETYEPMAQNVLRDLCGDILERHGLLAIRVCHSRGLVPVGACSFRLEVSAKHRKPALTAADEFIDRMKRDVPIWKHAVWRDRIADQP
ncbi:MAG: molybdopterin synthase catalytic subunit [Phycisphaerales bacterium]